MTDLESTDGKSDENLHNKNPNKKKIIYLNFREFGMPLVIKSTKWGRENN
jgi:hypothetical protein